MRDVVYPALEEEDGGLSAAEPVGILASGTLYRASKPVLPDGLPQTVEAALADIEEGEREFERGETFTHKEVMQMVWDKINCYAG